MIRAAAIALLLVAAPRAAAFDRFGVVAVSDPPSGPDADLAELAHQLRAACRDRIGGVEDVPTMRARLLGQTSNATLSELDRAYGGALAVYQNGEFESALRTLHAIVEDLESLPETADSYSQWVRAQMRLAHAALTLGREEEAERALYALARTDGGIGADPDQFSPSYRRRFDAIKGKVRALPARRLTVTSEGRSGTVFVNGRAMGATPLALWLPSGTYRIGGASEDLRVPSFQVDLRAEDRGVVLDFALAESLRVNAGPGLALPAASRGDGIVRAGAWLGVDRVIAVSRAFEGQAAFLLGSIYDVRRGALLREGSVRMVAGSVPAANLGALAAFLLTGQSSRDVKDHTDSSRDRAPVVAATVAAPPVSEAAPAQAPPAQPAVAPSPAPSVSAAASSPPRAAEPGAAKGVAAAAASTSSRAPSAEPLVDAPAGTRAAASSPPPTPAPSLTATPPPADAPSALDATLAASVEPRRGWKRPAAIGGGAVATGLAALALQQALAARSAYSDADAMLDGGVFVPGSDPARYRELQRDGDAARRNAFVSAGAAAVLAGAAAWLGWWSGPPAAEPALAFRF